MKLKSIEIIESKSRISSVDIFRGFAILPVVLFHFNNTLPFYQKLSEPFFQSFSI